MYANINGNDSELFSSFSFDLCLCVLCGRTPKPNWCIYLTQFNMEWFTLSSESGIIAAHLWFSIPFLSLPALVAFFLFLFGESISFSIDGSIYPSIGAVAACFRMYAIWNALTKCDQFRTIYVDLNSHWIIDDRFNRYILYCSIRIEIRIHTHTHARFGFTFMRIHIHEACQFTNSWIIFNLATVSLLRIENKMFGELLDE